MIEEMLQKEFEALKADFIEAYDAKGMRATGQWADALEVEVTADNESFHYKAVIKGLEYSQQLETGRSAGKQPPSTVIEQWIRDKGIASQIQGRITISSLAYLIARKIGREGWKREGFGGVDLISEVVTPERIQSIIDKVGDAYISKFSQDIIKELQTLAA